jgi:osmotically-inducible protein OsmY
MQPDHELHREIAARLDSDPSIRGEDIAVKVSDGVATLEGTVEDYAQRCAAERAVERVAGVRGVSNMLRLRSVPPAADVRQRIAEMLRRQAETDAGQITVEVSGHSIVLRGAVRSLAEKRDAEQAAWNVPGVTKVQNDLLVNPPVAAGV